MLGAKLLKLNARCFEDKSLNHFNPKTQFLTTFAIGKYTQTRDTPREVISLNTSCLYDPMGNATWLNDPCNSILLVEMHYPPLPHKPVGLGFHIGEYILMVALPGPVAVNEFNSITED